MSEQNVQAMRRLYDAFNAGDLEAFAKGLSPDIFWNEADSSLYSAGNPYRSFAAVIDGVFDPTARDFDNFRVDLEQLLDAGDYIVGTGRYRGTHKATGRDLSAQFCHVLHVDLEGKLDRVQEYADTLHEAEIAGRTQRAEDVTIRQPMPV
jgi:ketosteroid isomerase-like protein